MKKFALVAILGLAAAAIPAGEVNAQPLPYGGFYYRPAPTFGISYQSAYNPYGNRSYNAATVYSAPFGYGGPYTFGTYSFGSFERPIYSGPVSSIYYNPSRGGYYYGPGYRNSPTYSSNYYFGW